jgi:hypothetical protein
METRDISASGGLSPDGRFYWDGARWVPALSPDGRWRWTGTGWAPAPGAGTAAPAAAPFVSPRGRALAVVVVLGVFAGAMALATLGDLVSIAIRSSAGGRGLTDDQQSVADLVSGLPALLALPPLVAAIVLLPMWCHRAYRNLPALGARGLRYSPAWAAGAWFIPIMNIWRPYQVLRETWRHSRVEPAGTLLLNVYWGFWLASSYLDWLVTRDTLGSSGSVGSDAMDAASNVLDVTAAVLAALVVWRITAAQLRTRAGAG